MGNRIEKVARGVGVGFLAAAVGLGGSVRPVNASQVSEPDRSQRRSLVDCDNLGDYHYVNIPSPSGIGPGGTIFCPADSTVDLRTGAVQPKAALSTRKVRSK